MSDAADTLDATFKESVAEKGVLTDFTGLVVGFGFVFDLLPLLKRSP